jgi:hypothetical protein
VGIHRVNFWARSEPCIAKPVAREGFSFRQRQAGREQVNATTPDRIASCNRRLSLALWSLLFLLSSIDSSFQQRGCLGFGWLAVPVSLSLTDGVAIQSNPRNRGTDRKECPFCGAHQLEFHAAYWDFRLCPWRSYRREGEGNSINSLRAFGNWMDGS